MKFVAGSMLSLVLLVSGAWIYPAGAATPAPTLYHQPAYESPVRADPDDLLVLAGDGLSADDAIVYRAFASGKLAAHPAGLPGKSTAEFGLGDIVNAESAPLQLTIRLPKTIVPGRPYRLWVRTPGNQWSNAVAINDARPLWISPTVVFASQSKGSLPRYIKVVGRNLEPRGSRPIAVRLIGPSRYLLSEMLDASTDASVQRYSAALRLPREMVTGQYRVAVSVDGTSWIDVPSDPLLVIDDPHPPREFAISAGAFGGCRPNSDADDTACIGAAVNAAAAAGGGSVVLGAGSWNVVAGKIVLPPGVQLRGQGSEVTRLVRHDGADAALAAFTLLGNNEVSGIRFASDRLFGAEDRSHPMLQLGARYSTDLDPESSAVTVRDVVICNNIFDKSYIAITDGGAPIERLIVAHNRFGDFHSALELAGNRRNVRSRFRIMDSIISHNVVRAGKLDRPAARPRRGCERNRCFNPPGFQREHRRWGRSGVPQFAAGSAWVASGFFLSHERQP